MLRQTAELDVATDPHAGLFQAAEAPYECVIVSTDFTEFDPLAAMLAVALARPDALPADHSGLADAGEDQRIIRGLELGINDYLTRPIDEQELTARLGTQIKRKRYNDHLRASVTADDRDGGDRRSDRAAQ